MAVPHEPPGEAGAHSAQADNSKLHGSFGSHTHFLSIDDIDLRNPQDEPIGGVRESVLVVPMWSLAARRGERLRDGRDPDRRSRVPRVRRLDGVDAERANCGDAPLVELRGRAGRHRDSQPPSVLVVSGFRPRHLGLR
jgi:hypothetical protein